MLLQACKLTYFGIPGRGEATRLALTIGKIEFTDNRIAFGPEWKNLKPTTTWGGLPFLTLADGSTEIHQQRAILRFVGKETHLYPTDTIKAAKVDELMDALEDIGAKTNAAGQGLSKEEKEAARKAACAKGGVTYGVLERVDNFIAANGTGGYAVGDSMTVADLLLYTQTSNLVSGLFDGVPTDTLEPFSNIAACRKVVRSDPAVTQWYDGLGDTMPASYAPL